MEQFLYVILLNTAVFMAIFFSLKYYDKRSGKDTVKGLKVTYIISIIATTYITYSGLKSNGVAIELKTFLLTFLICMFPVSALVNCGYAIAVIIKAFIGKVKGTQTEKETEKTVSVIKTKRAKKKK